MHMHEPLAIHARKSCYNINVGVPATACFLKAPSRRSLVPAPKALPHLRRRLPSEIRKERYDTQRPTWFKSLHVCARVRV